jgi:hypothetical protein
MRRNQSKNNMEKLDLQATTEQLKGLPSGNLMLSGVVSSPVSSCLLTLRKALASWPNSPWSRK